MKIGLKLTIYFFIIAFFSMLVVGIISYHKAKSSLKYESFNRLTAVREMKATQIEDYFQLISDQVSTFAEDRMIVYGTRRLKEAFNNIDKSTGFNEANMRANDSLLRQYFEKEYLPRLNKNLRTKATFETESSKDIHTRILQTQYIASNPNPVGEKHFLNQPYNDTSGYSKAHANFHPVVKKYLEKFGYYDIFIVDNKTGNIIYSVFKEVDFATSLLTGPFKNTNLAEAFREAAETDNKDFVKLVDFKPYNPSYYAPAAFIAAPIYDDQTKIGVLIFQLPIARINDVMTNKQQWEKVGLGKSGETYLVGEDYKLRNQSRFLIEDSTNYFKMIKGLGVKPEVIKEIRSFNSSIGLQEVKTQGTKAALKGETNAETFPDYRDVPVLSAYRPLNIKGMHWVIMSEIDEEEAFQEVYSLRRFIVYCFAGLVGLVILASVVIARGMTKPLKLLTYDAREIAKGNMDVEITIKRKDEIGILALSFKKMQVSIKNLIGDLKHINANLEQKVAERTHDLHRQKEMVEEKNKEILDSINYAQRLQNAILPTVTAVKSHLTDSFILFKPKDIVSGDFYWMYTHGNEIKIAAVDCTGHGVPGAMVSVVGANNLDRCVKEFGLKKPSDILDKLCDLVIETFETQDHEVKDGMDISLCSIDFKAGKMEFAAAHNPMWIVRHDTREIEEIKADKQPIGKFDYRKPFTNNVIDIKKGDCIYLFSDGYADQFGGPNGKKFKYKTMQNLLQEIHDKPMEEQKHILNDEFEKWRGSLEQIDDVCVIGIRV
ncbi:MAG TPA: SpoIIE family protein phosphatase [Flavobacteriales bacterium]|nr:SpoIIE family protein phosphatase [Flavobacteriales bacterium]